MKQDDTDYQASGNGLPSKQQPRASANNRSSTDTKQMIEKIRCKIQRTLNMNARTKRHDADTEKAQDASYD